MKLDRDKLLRARESLGYGVEKTAEEAGVSKNSVLRAEHEGDIRPVTARKIAGALGVRVADLLMEEETPPKGSGRSSLEPKPFNGLEGERRTEAADRFLRFGARMVAQWDSELPGRIEAEDEGWLREVVAMYEEYTEILSLIGARGTPNPGESLGHVMDINGFSHRLVTMVQEHNERCRGEGAEDGALEVERLVGKGVRA